MTSLLKPGKKHERRLKNKGIVVMRYYLVCDPVRVEYKI